MDGITGSNYLNKKLSSGGKGSFKQLANKSRSMSVCISATCWLKGLLELKRYGNMQKASNLKVATNVKSSKESGNIHKDSTS